jgi:L-arabinokinase
LPEPFACDIYASVKKIRYYITGHGLGHASRSCQVINTLRRRHPGIAVEVVSDAHAWFFEGFLDPSVLVRRRRLDIGVLQQDSLIMQEGETFRACRELMDHREAIVAEEARSLREQGVDVVAADIPALAFAAAAGAHIPGVGISNFSWDWIYGEMAPEHPDCADVVQSMRRDYACSDLLLRLPFHGPCDAFRSIEDLPLVARRSACEPAGVRRALGIPDDVRVGLISFGGFGLKDFDFSFLATIPGWFFLAETEMAADCANIRIITPGRIPYPDLVGAADAVITKPGYGIVSEAIANDTAVLYTSRGAFPEQPLLVDGLHRYGRAREIDNDRLRRGDWGEELEALLGQPSPKERPATNGDEVAADRLAELCEY